MSAWLLLLLLPSCLTTDSPRVKTALGWLQGSHKVSEPGGRKFAAYEGIPYAVPPIERLRFQPPMKTTAHEDNFHPPSRPFQATQPPPECPQLDLLTSDYKGSEDCLYLNVFTPQLDSSEDQRLPVMVWIHGGAFRLGSSTSLQYGPERLLDKDVIVVSINYRLGPLGFLTTGDSEAPPNVGLLDQQLALRWVRDNIRDYGGDPDRVTLFGESAGGISVMAHIASPYSKGLFHQAISMSGVWGEMPFLHKSKPPSSYADQLAEGVGCDTSSGSEKTVTCLKEKSPKDLLLEAAKLRTFDFMPEPFTPVVDDFMEHPLLPKPLHEVWSDPSSPSSVPLMIGGTEHEGIVALLEFLKDQTKLDKLNEDFATEGPALLLGVDPVLDPLARDEGETATAEVLRSLYFGSETKFSPANQEALIQLLSDVHVLAPLDRTVRQYSLGGAPLYYYSYRHKGSFSLPMAVGVWENLGVSHMDELFLLFKFAEVSESWFGDLALKTEDDIAVSKKLVSLWTNFAKTGRPTEDDSWEPVTSGSLQYAVLDSGPIRMDYSQKETSRWKEVVEMFDLARKARLFSKDTHPAFEALKKEKEELLQEERTNKAGVKEADLVDAIDDIGDEEEETPTEKKDTFDEDKWEKEMGMDWDDPEAFDPIKAMMSLMEQEVGEGKEFKEHLKKMNVNLADLGLEAPWGTQEGHDEL